MLSKLLAALCALSVAAAPAAAQSSPAPEPEPSPAPEERPNLEGEAIGYLAVPVLLVLTIIVGLLIGGGDEEPESP